MQAERCRKFPPIIPWGNDCAVWFLFQCNCFFTLARRLHHCLSTPWEQEWMHTLTVLRFVDSVNCSPHVVILLCRKCFWFNRDFLTLLSRVLCVIQDPHNQNFSLTKVLPFQTENLDNVCESDIKSFGFLMDAHTVDAHSMLSCQSSNSLLHHSGIKCWNCKASLVANCTPTGLTVCCQQMTTKHKNTMSSHFECNVCNWTLSTLHQNCKTKWFGVSEGVQWWAQVGLGERGRLSLCGWSPFLCCFSGTKFVRTQWFDVRSLCSLPFLFSRVWNCSLFLSFCVTTDKTSHHELLVKFTDDKKIDKPPTIDNPPSFPINYLITKRRRKSAGQFYSLKARCDGY